MNCDVKTLNSKNSMSSTNQIDQDTAQMIFDPRSPMRDRSPLPYSKKIDASMIEKIDPVSLMFSENFFSSSTEDNQDKK